MRLYLSGPVSGCLDSNIPAFRQATADLRGIGYEVVSPLEEDDRAGVDPNNVSAAGETWGSLLARDVKLLADGGIEGIVVLPDWDQSKGAKLEVFLGMLLHLPLFHYNGVEPPVRFSWFEAAHLVFKTLTGVA